MIEENKVLSNEDREDVVDSQPNEGFEKEQQGVATEIFETESADENDIETGESQEDVEGVAEPQVKSEQSHEENAQFKKMRLQARQEAERELAEQMKELQALQMSIEQQKSEQKIINEYLNPDRIYDYADKEGISEEHAKRLLELEAQNIIQTEKTKIAETMEKQAKVKSELAKDPYFKLLEKEVDELMKINPNHDYETLYYVQKGRKADELQKQLASSVEKQTVANIHDRARRKSIGGGGSSTTPSSGLSKFGEEFASFMGVDPREAAQIVKERNKKR